MATPEVSRFITALIASAAPRGADLAAMRAPEATAALKAWWPTEDSLRQLAGLRQRVADMPQWVLDLAAEYGVEIPTA